MKIRIAAFNFIVPVLTFALAAMLDIVTDESDPGALLAFLLEAAVVIALPIFNYRQEKELSGEVTAKQYNAGYFLGYFLAAAAVTVFINSVDVRKFFPERDTFIWLDLRGLGLMFLAILIAAGFIWALVFRGAAWVIKHIK